MHGLSEKAVNVICALMYNFLLIFSCITVLIGVLCFVGTLTEVVHGCVMERSNRQSVVYVKHDDIPDNNQFTDEEKVLYTSDPTSMHQVQVSEGIILTLQLDDGMNYSIFEGVRLSRNKCKNMLI